MQSSTLYDKLLLFINNQRENFKNGEKAGELNFFFCSVE